MAEDAADRDYRAQGLEPVRYVAVCESCETAGKVLQFEPFDGVPQCPHCGGPRRLATPAEDAQIPLLVLA
jgi:hypothetical protein